MSVSKLRSQYITSAMLFLFQVMAIAAIAAGNKGPLSGKSVRLNDEEITFEAQPAKKTGIFNAGESIVYNVDIKSTYAAKQSGTISYLLSGWDNKEVARKSEAIELSGNGKKNVTLRMPGQKSGMYKVNIMINVTEYDDTIRRQVAVDPKNIRSTTPAPADFDQFWARTRDSLAKIPMDAKVTEQPKLAKDGLKCYLVELRSWGKIIVRGWLTMSDKKRKPSDKMPVWLAIPGYGGIGVKPIYGNEDLAVFAFNPRGQGNSKDFINPSREGYLTTDIERKERYILRGAMMDCIRALDFISSRPELDEKNIVCSGGSMGGYFTLAIASMDNRIKICSANNPVFCDYRSLVGSKDWPMKNIQDYGKSRRIPLNTLLNNLDYYDLKNFAPKVKCKSLIGISLMDNLAPPYNEFVMLNNLTNDNRLRVYPNLAHEVPPSLFKYLSSWMMDEFGLF
jgi:cephalosporin-C deacetylase